MADILHRVGIRASPDQVYRALATAEGVAGWWTTDSSGEDKVGGKLKFRFRTGDGRELGFFDMKILELQPGARVLWQVTDGPEEWLGTRVAFDLRQEGDFTMVVFKHQGWKEPIEFMHHCSTKWAVFLLSLKAYAETGKGAPSPRDVKIDNFN